MPNIGHEPEYVLVGKLAKVLNLNGVVPGPVGSLVVVSRDHAEGIDELLSGAPAAKVRSHLGLSIAPIRQTFNPPPTYDRKRR